jgi:hypothetical protein
VIPRGALRSLADELADEFVAEAVLEPSDLKPLSPVLAQLPAYVLLIVNLLIRNFKKLAQVIYHGKEKSNSVFGPVFDELYGTAIGCIIEG